MNITYKKILFFKNLICIFNFTKKINDKFLHRLKKISCQILNNLLI